MNNSTQIDIINDISSWNPTGSFAHVRNSLKASSTNDIKVVVNSFGGSVLEGLAIYNLLKGEKTKNITTHIPAYAMSAATVIAMAGQKLTMAENGYFMIHNPWTFTVGDQHDHNDTAGLLESMADMMADIYTAKTKMPKKEIKQMMDKETWLTAKEAHSMGFVDELTPGADMQASLKPHLPELSTRYTHATTFFNENPITMDTPTPQEQSFMQRMEAFFAKLVPVTAAPAPAEPDNAALTALQAQADTLAEANAAAEARIAELQASLDTASARIAELEATPAAGHTTVVAEPVAQPDAAKSYHSSPLTLKAQAIQQRQQLNLNL